jgi:hypothetical protein
MKVEGWRFGSGNPDELRRNRGSRVEGQIDRGTTREQREFKIAKVTFRA